MLSADNEIDYKAQLKINLRYRDFLKKMNSYNEYNRLLVDRILTNYVFLLCIMRDVKKYQKSRRNESDSISRKY